MCDPTHAIKLEIPELRNLDRVIQHVIVKCVILKEIGERVWCIDDHFMMKRIILGLWFDRIKP